MLGRGIWGAEVLGQAPWSRLSPLCLGFFAGLRRDCSKLCLPEVPTATSSTQGCPGRDHGVRGGLQGSLRGLSPSRCQGTKGAGAAEGAQHPAGPKPPPAAGQTGLQPAPFTGGVWPHAAALTLDGAELPAACSAPSGLLANSSKSPAPAVGISPSAFPLGFPFSLHPA